jgi:hypothetical protein
MRTKSLSPARLVIFGKLLTRDGHTMTATEEQLLADHFPILLPRVATLPPSGFRGTVRQLWTSLFIVAVNKKLNRDLPSFNMLSRTMRAEADHLASLGWQLRFKRTNKQALLIVQHS